ncbi:LytR/AlgR family response regulator transcription factor [Spirosoma endophyticum]|uniref:Two component transcriptional regulator, LytTR family n=1 Tax=Spirosoma endophyticum TaxID=662367 RepID=A0A1I2I715_9BACT|nr:LytTR family DNA-binding domain-containing protein [Spirosoma endophyticum]SFF38092.1 two component transcriptional regulator, LytTR family [Spirosoma endophyticum]
MNPSYRVIVLDDEPPARELMEVFVNRLPDLRCVASCANAMQGLQAIQELKPDLLLLDIQMPEMTGLELMRLPLEHRPEVILTTAYADYAVASYEFSVLDYLLKPIAFDRFVSSIVKFRQKRPVQPPTQPGWRAVDSRPTDEPKSGQPPYESDANAIWLREDKRLLQIPYQDILYIEGLRDYVKVFLSDQMILTHMGIGQAESLFQPPLFLRIHRSFIVRRSAIRLIDGNTIVLTNGKQLTIGPLYRETLKNYIAALP